MKYYNLPEYGEIDLSSQHCIEQGLNISSNISSNNGLSYYYLKEEQLARPGDCLAGNLFCVFAYNFNCNKLRGECKKRLRFIMPTSLEHSSIPIETSREKKGLYRCRFPPERLRNPARKAKGRSKETQPHFTGKLLN